MIISNNNISYENAWKKLKTISEPAMLIVAIIHLGKLLFTKGERTFNPVGIGVHEFEALFSIKHMETPTPTILSQCSLTRPTKITRVLDKLEQMGAITRHPIKGDRRSYSLALTAKGEELLGEATLQFREAADEMSSKLGMENVRLLSMFVIGIIENLGGTRNENVDNSGQPQG